jgi:hypothetical protein
LRGNIRLEILSARSSRSCGGARALSESNQERADIDLQHALRTEPD